MPIYEYECKKCKVVIEKLVVNKNKKKKVKCVICGGTMRRVMSTSNFRI